MPKRRREAGPAPGDPGLTAGELKRLREARHTHVAEIHGENETRHLTRWARRRVIEVGMEARRA